MKTNVLMLKRSCLWRMGSRPSPAKNPLSYAYPSHLGREMDSRIQKRPQRACRRRKVAIANRVACEPLRWAGHQHIFQLFQPGCFFGRQFIRHHSSSLFCYLINGGSAYEPKSSHRILLRSTHVLDIGSDSKRLKVATKVAAALAHPLRLA